MAIDMTDDACCATGNLEPLSDDEAAATADVLRSLADPARVKIVALLAASGRDVCACEFEPMLGLTQATVSHHLKKLTEAGLLLRDQRGKWAHFSLVPERLEEIAGLIRALEVRDGVAV